MSDLEDNTDALTKGQLPNTLNYMVAKSVEN